MPIYEYQCQHCNHLFEVIQKMSDAPIQVCPECHEAKATRLVSAAGFQLKGTGWYVTDFKDKGKPKAAANPSAEAKSPAAATSATAQSSESGGASDK